MKNGGINNLPVIGKERVKEGERLLVGGGRKAGRKDASKERKKDPNLLSYKKLA